MSEKELENITPEVEEVTEEIEETASESEATEEVVEEQIEEASDITDEITQTAQDVYENADEVLEDGEVTTEEIQEVVEEIIEKKKKSKAPFVIIAIIIVLAIIAAVVVNSFGGNKYNKLGYANPDGRTIADIAEEMEITVEEFLERYSLPEDMPADTEEMAAYYSMPVKVFAEMYGVDFATFKDAYGIPEETTPAVADGIMGKIKALFGGNKIVPIDENTPWGVVLDEITLANYVGEENLDAFKEYYGLGDEVTAETRYKEIRKVVEEKTMELAAEAKAAEEAQKAETEETSSDDVATTDEVVADETTEVAPIEE